MTTLSVGPDEEFATLSAAVAASQDGDVIQVQAGTYTNDFSEITTQITIEGVGGMVDLVATEPPPNEKGILTTDTNVTIENVSFSGAEVSDDDGGNGAGVRYQGGALTLINDDFHDNQDGILGNPDPTGSIDIDNSTFEDNGSGSGYTHDIYIGDIANFTLANSTVSSAVIGHEVKSRAENNTITGNVIQDGPTGTSSYEIDLPDGGNDIVSGNTIEKGPNAQNDAMVHFGGEGIPYANSALTLSSNVFVNDYGPAAVAVLNQSLIPVIISGNTFDGLSASQVVDGAATESNNVGSDGTLFPDGSSAIAPGGNATIFTDDNPHTVTLTQSNFAVEGAGGLLTVSAPAGHVTVVGGSGGLVFTDVDAGGDYITTAQGATDTITLYGEDTVSSAGSDVIKVGPGNSTVQATGNAAIHSGAGDNGYTLSGRDILVAGKGSDTVDVTSTGHVVITGAETFLEFSDLGGWIQFNIKDYGVSVGGIVEGGSSSFVLAYGTISATTAGGSTGVLMKLGAGTDVITSVGPDTIYAGTGQDTVIVSGAAQVYAGTGTLSVYGRSDQAGATVHGGAGHYLIGGDTGNITFIGGAARGYVAMDVSSMTVQGGAGRLAVTGTGGDEVVNGGSGGIDFTSSGGNDVISTKAGATDRIVLAGGSVVQSAGNDTISGGSANQIITVSGHSTITGSTGNSTYTLNGDDTLISRSQGTDRIAIGAAAHAHVATATAALIEMTSAGGTIAFVDTAGGSDEAVTIGGGSATLSMAAGQAATIVTADQGGSAITLAGGDTMLQSGGADTVSAGAGTLAMTGAGQSTVYGGSGSFTYNGGAGSMEFIGGAGSAVIDGGSGTTHVVAGSGNVTLNGGTAGSTFVAGSGSATVVEGNSGATVQFGAADTTVTGGAAADLYDFVAGTGGGHDIIQGFKTGQDQLIFRGYSGTFMTSEKVVAGSLLIGLSDRTQITLAGVTSLAANSIKSVS